jgi:SAM-dependent methyltransferase
VSQVEYAELAEFYDLINERCIDYDRQAAWVSAFLQQHIGPDGCVLDLACATGQHAARLRKAGYRVVGLDRSPNLLRIGRRRRRLAEVVVGDMRRIGLGRHFDAVLCLNHTVNYMVGGDLRACIAEVGRVLKPDGLLILDFFDYGPVPEWNAIWRDSVSAEGVRIDMIHWMSPNRAGTVATDAHTYRVLRNGLTTTHRGEDRLRITHTRQMLTRIRRAGFTVIEHGRKTELGMGPETSSVTVAAVLRST